MATLATPRLSTVTRIRVRYSFIFLPPLANRRKEIELVEMRLMILNYPCSALFLFCPSPSHLVMVRFFDEAAVVPLAAVDYQVGICCVIRARLPAPTHHAGREPRAFVLAVRRSARSGSLLKL